MGESPIVLYAIIGLLVIVFGVLIGFSFKVWRVLHALMVIAVFLATGAFIFLLANTLKIQSNWIEQYEIYRDRVAAEEQRLEELLQGNPARPETVATSLETLQKKVNLAMIGRGLIWRGLIRANVDTSGEFVAVTLDTTYYGDSACIAPGAPEVAGAPAPEAAEGEGGEAPAIAKLHGITPGMVLYAFQEQSAANLGLDLGTVCRIPQQYLGQFVVQQSTADSPTIELVSLLPRDEIPATALAAIEQDGEGLSWSLYGTMPIDRHDLFADLSLEELQLLLPGVPAETLQTYTHDFEPATEADPAENVWVRVRFTQPYSLTVDMHGLQGAAPPAEGGLPAPAGEAPAQPGGATAPPEGYRYFTPEGLAIMPDLRHGDEGTVELEPGEEIVLPAAAAQQLVDEGMADEVERVYVRPLRDYANMMAGLRVRNARVEDQIAVTNHDIERQEAANVLAGEQVVSARGVRDLVQQDLAGFEQELEVVRATQAQVTQDYRELQQICQQLYRSMTARANQYTQMQFELKRQIESGEAPEPSTPEPEQTSDLAAQP